MHGNLLRVTVKMGFIRFKVLIFINNIFFLQCINGIQGKKLYGKQWNRLLGIVVKILKYKKITIDHAICIKVFSNGTVSYLTVYSNDVINTTNNNK